MSDQPFDSAPMLAALAETTNHLMNKVEDPDPQLVRKLEEEGSAIKSRLDQAAAAMKKAWLESPRLRKRRPCPKRSGRGLLAMGLDPDHLEPLTREEVIERHGQGLSLAGRDLSGLDLSGLDLAGTDLHQAILEKAKLTGTNLSGANLSEALANEADFSQADLSGARLKSGLFSQASLAARIWPLET
jgi:uncharacterized protein YjbI with pentapeptide repeats